MSPVTLENEIIMVDDNDADLEAAEYCYKRSKLATHPWRALMSGEALLDYLAEVKSGSRPMPLLVLLDINMPGLDGFETLAEVKKDPYFADLPVFLMLTTSTSHADRERAAHYGVTGFFTKPADLEGYVAFFDSLEVSSAPPA